MKLHEFLANCKNLIEKNPDALNLEMFTINGSSGTGNRLGHIYIDKISDFDNDFPVWDMLPDNYPYNSILWIYNGS